MVSKQFTHANKYIWLREQCPLFKTYNMILWVICLFSHISWGIQITQRISYENVLCLMNSTLTATCHTWLVCPAPLKIPYRCISRYSLGYSCLFQSHFLEKHNYLFKFVDIKSPFTRKQHKIARVFISSISLHVPFIADSS